MSNQSDYKIDLPSRFSDNFGNSIDALFRLQNDIHFHYSSHNIILDYQEATFTHPFYTLALPLLLKIYERRGIKIGLNCNFNLRYVKDYMSLIEFPEGIIPENLPRQNIQEYLDKYKNKTYIPILNFPTSENLDATTVRDNFLSAINSIISQQAKLDAIMKTAVLYLIDEAISNIIHHSFDDRGYALAQVYTSKGYMDICIADIGRTLLDSYISTGRHTLITTHLEAMRAALSGKSTKSNNVDRGFGISTSKKMLTKGLNGKYFLYSGNTFNIHTSEINDIIELPESIYWQGVYLAMRIPLVARPGFNPSDYYE